MLKQLCWVLATYLTRPLCWVMFALAAVFWGFLGIGVWSNTSTTPQSEWEVIRPVPKLLVSSWEENRFTPANHLRSFSNQTAAVQAVEALSVEVFYENDRLPTSAEMPRLRFLEIRGKLQTRHCAQLADLRSLETIVADTTPELVMEPGIAALLSLPRLSELYINDRSVSGGSDLFGYLQWRLPHVRVRAERVDVRRFHTMPAAIVGLLVWMLLLLAQISSHFLPAFARLTPEFAMPHVIVDLAFWLAGMVIATGLIAGMGNDVWASAAFVSLWQIPLAVGFGLSFPAASSRRRTPLWVAIGLLCIGAVWLRMSVGTPLSTLDWVLRGRQPTWTAVALFVNTASVVWASVRLLRLHSLWQESGQMVPILGFDLRQIDATVSLRGSVAAKRSWQWWVAFGQERRLEQFITRSQCDSDRVGAGRWIRGNMLCVWDGLVFVGLLTLMMLAIPAAFWLIQGEVPNEICKLTFVMAIMFSAMGSFVTAGHWLSRPLMLAGESLRPNSRSQFIRELWLALLIDLLPAAVWQLAATLIGGLIVSKQPTLPLWNAAALAATWLALFGGLLWLMSLRPSFGQVIAAATLFVSVMLGQMLSCMMALEFRESDTWLVLAVITALGGGIGAVLTATAWRRWNRLEFGR